MGEAVLDGAKLNGMLGEYDGRGLGTPHCPGEYGGRWRRASRVNLCIYPGSASESATALPWRELGVPHRIDALWQVRYGGRALAGRAVCYPAQMALWQAHFSGSALSGALSRRRFSGSTVAGSLCQVRF